MRDCHWRLEPPAEGGCPQSRIHRDPFHGASIAHRDDRDYRQKQRERDWRACQTFPKRTRGFLPAKHDAIRRERQIINHEKDCKSKKHEKGATSQISKNG